MSKHKHWPRMAEAPKVPEEAIAVLSAADSLPPERYRADYQNFTLSPGESIGQVMTDYINRFANEHNAALLNCQNMGHNTIYLFVWEMP